MADITFYKSTINEFDTTLNGGDKTEIIESGVLNNLLPDVRAYTAEFGGERWFKFFIQAGADLINIGVDIAIPTISSSEEVLLALASSVEEVESDLNKENIRLYGSFKVNSYDAAAKKVTDDRDVSEFVKAGDVVTFYDGNEIKKIVSWIVGEVNKDEITFSSSNITNVSSLYASSTIMLDKLNSGEYRGFWLKQIIEPYTQAMDADLFFINVWYELK